MNREVGLCSHSLSHSSPVPNKLHYTVSVDIRDGEKGGWGVMGGGGRDYIPVTTLSPPE